MLTMAVFACYLAVVIADQLVNVFISIFTSYLILTAWVTVRRDEGAVGVAEKIALRWRSCCARRLRFSRFSWRRA